MKTLLLITLLFPILANASDYCVTGLKGTIASNYIFKVSKHPNGERMLGVYDLSKNPVFVSKAENKFTQFNSNGYGVCSITASGTDITTGAQIKAELKVAPHFKSACNQIGMPASVEYITLKIVPKGTTLGDDLTAYALSPIPCPN